MCKDKRWTKRDGKRFLYEAGLLLNFLAFICLFIAFCTPYWIISWPRVYSGFRKVGLWEACFAGLVLETDPTQKAYHGCWWILAPEFKDIRGWLMPPWFIFTQVNLTLNFIAYALVFIILFINWINTGKTQKNQAKKRSDHLTMVQTGCAITVGAAIMMSINMLIFAVCYRFDKYWLPIPFFNYLSWSYGLALLSTFMQIFAGIAEVTYVLIIRQEMREPPAPTTVPLAGLLTKKEGAKGPMAFRGGEYKGSTKHLDMGSSSRNLDMTASNKNIYHGGPDMKSSTKNLYGGTSNRNLHGDSHA